MYNAPREKHGTIESMVSSMGVALFVCRASGHVAGCVKSMSDKPMPRNDPTRIRYQ